MCQGCQGKVVSSEVQQYVRIPTSNRWGEHYYDNYTDNLAEVKLLIKVRFAGHKTFST